MVVVLCVFCCICERSAWGYPSISLTDATQNVSTPAAFETFVVVVVAYIIRWLSILKHNARASNLGASHFVLQIEVLFLTR